MNKDLISRFLTALVAGTATIGALVFSPYGLWLFCLVVSQIGLWEFGQVMNVRLRRYAWPLWLLGLAIWALALAELLNDGTWPTDPLYYAAIALLILPILSVIALFNPNEKQPVEVISILVMGMIYSFLPLLLLFKLAVPGDPALYTYQLPLGILVLTWTLDVFAYFTGRFLGKHPLFPRISPKKTWEGAIGGAVFCLMLGFLLQYYAPLPQHSWVVIAFIISIISQLGDLAESMFKRSRRLKDSGSLLPGHGGMLDRFDGIYFSMPFIYLYFSLL